MLASTGRVAHNRSIEQKSPSQFWGGGGERGARVCAVHIKNAYEN